MRHKIVVVMLGATMAAAISYNAEQFRSETQILRDRRSALANRPQTYDYADTDVLGSEFYDDVASTGSAQNATDVFLLVMPSDDDSKKRLLQCLDKTASSGFRGEIRVVSAHYDDASLFSIAPPAGTKLRFVRMRDATMFSRQAGIRRLPFAMLSRDSVIRSIMVGEFLEGTAAEFLSHTSNAPGTKLFETPAGTLQGSPGEFAEAKP